MFAIYVYVWAIQIRILENIQTRFYDIAFLRRDMVISLPGAAYCRFSIVRAFVRSLTEVR